MNITGCFSIELKQNPYRAFHYSVSGYNARAFARKVQYLVRRGSYTNTGY